MKKLLYLSIIFCSIESVTCQTTHTVSYLNPEYVQSAYKFLRFGNSSAYYGGILWNNNSTFYGDGDDYSFFSYGNRDITFYTGTGNVIMFPMDGGRVAIGTPTPKGKLHIKHSSGSFTADGLILEDYTGSSYYNLINSANHLWIGYSADGGSSYTTRFIINANGNVGIGGSSAYGKLQVNAEGNPLDNDWCIHPFHIRGSDQCMYMGVSTTDRVAYIQSVDIGTSASNLVLNALGGNIGIGQIHPIAKLQVQGSMGVGKSVCIDNREIKFRGDGVAHYSIFANRTNNYFTIENTSSSYIMGTGGTSLLAINPSGQVGIGCTDFSLGYKLSVNGEILCEAINVIVDVPSSDFVFDNDYNLMSLPELKLYITKNRHLPEIPSSDEFKRNGYNLGEMDDLLLRKIEELTLHLIEQEEKIRELEVQIKEMKNN